MLLDIRNGDSMSETARSVVTTGRAAAKSAGNRWRRLDRDWQSVVLGFAILSMVVFFEIRIPW